MKKQFRSDGKKHLVATLISYIVALHGFAIILTPLIFISLPGRTLHFYPGRFVFDAQLLLALTLIYLSVLLRRRKRTALLVTVVVYICLMLISIDRLFDAHLPFVQLMIASIRDITVPLLIIGGLTLARREFTVRSDIRTFAVSLRISLLVLCATLIYGVGGFMVLDRHDFHKEISIGEAMHRTVDQFELTTSDSLSPYTGRARTFLHSLSLLSTVAVGYAFISLFQPIRARFSDQTSGRALAEKLLADYPGNSEDFFKIWPHDKSYFFATDHQAGLAYGVKNGVALVVGDPIGNPDHFANLLYQFDTFCEANDWQVTFVHVEPAYLQLFKERSLTAQKIGEEAVLHLGDFLRDTARNKYFRQINNRFIKQGYTIEVAKPPHNTALLSRLHEISNEWLTVPGRKERTFMMGNFTEAYMQQCQIVVLKDAEGIVQGFLNQLPTYDAAEANFDLLRHSHAAMGNSNDFILLSWAKLLHEQGYRRLNLGLCPLAGLDAPDEAASVTNNALRFLYANGDRFYSFSGLQRFKSKYNPEWQGRYIVYRGGIRGFTKALNALNRAMKL